MAADIRAAEGIRNERLCRLGSLALAARGSMRLARVLVLAILACNVCSGFAPMRLRNLRASERVTAMKAIVVKEISAVGLIQKPLRSAGTDDAIVQTRAIQGVVAEVGSAVQLSDSGKWNEPSRWRTW